VARFYSNENIPAQVVAELRRMGHDVLTILEAGKANSSVPDAEVLAFAMAEGRILLSHNRRRFLQLHQRRSGDHAGMVLCTVDADFVALARRINEAVTAEPRMMNNLIRVNRPPQ
jgi:predicted nuclease of predicted toxin-antitoxin system